MPKIKEFKHPLPVSHFATEEGEHYFFIKDDKNATECIKYCVAFFLNFADGKNGFINYDNMFFLPINLSSRIEQVLQKVSLGKTTYFKSLQEKDTRFIADQSTLEMVSAVAIASAKRAKKIISITPTDVGGVIYVGEETTYQDIAKQYTYLATSFTRYKAINR